MKKYAKKREEHVRTLREGRRQFLWRKTIPLICLVSSKSRKSTFMNAYHLQILPQPHMLAQGFLKKPFNGFLRAFAFIWWACKNCKKYIDTHISQTLPKKWLLQSCKITPLWRFFRRFVKADQNYGSLGTSNLQNWRLHRFRLSRDLEEQTHLCMWWRKCYFMVHKRLLIFFLLDFENRGLGLWEQLVNPLASFPVAQSVEEKAIEMEHSSKPKL